MSELRRAKRILNLLALLPLIIVASFYIGARVPDRWRNLYVLAAASVILGIVVVIPVRERLRSERRGGFVPRRGGFSGKLEIAAEKIRAHADLVDEEGLEAGGHPLLQSYLAELQRVAKAQDGYDLVPGLELEPEGDPAAHAAKLRKAAADVDAYAQTVRIRGGIFQLDTTQRLYLGAIVAGMVAYGLWLMVRSWSTPGWTFLGGALLVAFGVLIGFGLILSQRDADATHR